MKTTMKILKCFIMALAITAFTASCQKDNLEDAVLPQTAQGEQGTTGTNGQNGTDGQNGAQGEQGLKGDKGEQGDPGQTGEDGADGEQGPQGEQGPAGPKGDDGQNTEDGAAGAQGPKGDAGDTGPIGPKGDTGDTGPKGDLGDAGSNGTDGRNGEDGQNGEDGNANVRSITYNLSSVSSSNFSFEIPEITGDVLRNDVILSYLQFSGVFLYPIPSKVIVGLGGTRSFRADVDIAFWIGSGSLIFREIGGTTSIRDSDINAGDLSQLRIVIIESTSSESRKTAKQNVRQELKAAGVDINNYDAVASYYGLR